MASPGGTFWFRKRKSEGVKVSNRIPDGNVTVDWTKIKRVSMLNNSMQSLFNALVLLL